MKNQWIKVIGYNGKIFPVIGYLYLFFMGVIYFVIHYKAGFSFPIPWIDEASFLWPAINWQEHTTLFSPQLNPERHIFWMPPGYHIVLGTIFKLTGFSLQLSRDISAIFFLLTILFIYKILKNNGISLFLILLLTFVGFSSFGIVVGNVARMEAMLLFITFLSLYLIINKHRYYIGMGLLCLSPLVHPNGVFFCFSGLLSIFIVHKYNRLKPNAADCLFLSIVILIWLSYGFYIALNWDDFIADMAFQFSRKGSYDILSSLKSFYLSRYFLLFIICCFYAIIRKIKIVLIAANISFFCYSVQMFGNEMWYYIFPFIGRVLFLSAVVIVLQDVLKRFVFKNQRPYTSNAFYHFSIIIVCVFALYQIWSEEISKAYLTYPPKLVWAGMRMPDEKSTYIRKNDIKILKQFLRNARKTSQKKIIIETFPQAEGLLLYERDSEIEFIQPTFRESWANVSLLHISTYTPQWLEGNYRKKAQSMGIDLQNNLIHMNVSSGYWFLNQKEEYFQTSSR